MFRAKRGFGEAVSRTRRTSDGSVTVPDGGEIDAPGRNSRDGRNCDKTVNNRVDLLATLPDEVVRQILGVLHSSRTARDFFELGGRSLELAVESYAFACTCRRVRALFRSNVRSLDIHWEDPVGAGIVSYFAPELHSLSIFRHNQSVHFIEGVALHRPSLRNIVLSACPVDYAVLERAIFATRHTLTSFSLEYVNNVSSATVGTAISVLAHCPQLRALSLHGLPDLTHASLCRVLTPELRTLSLGYLRNRSMGGNTLEEIGLRCKNLQSLTVHDTRWTTSSAVVDLCVRLGSQLRILSLESCQLTDSDILAIATGCPNLVSLRIKGDSQRTISAGALASAVQALSPKLVALDVCRTCKIGDRELNLILSAAPRLRDLRIRDARDVTDRGIRDIVCRLKETLEVLDVRGVSVSDAGLTSLGELQCVRALHIGTEAVAGDNLFQNPPARVCISNAGVEELLRGCGRTLQRFQCENVGAAGQLSGSGRTLPPHCECEGILRSIASHCSDRLTICVLQQMRPPMRDRVDRARVQLRAIELEEKFSDCVVYTDREAPKLGSLTLQELL